MFKIFTHCLHKRGAAVMFSAGKIQAGCTIRQLLRELFDTLPKKDRDILGKTCGVFGYSEASLKEIGMYHMMKESAVEKAKNRAVEKLREAYPGSRLQVWRAVHRMMRRPVPPPGEDSELRRNFPQYVLALAEVYGVLNEATSDIDNISI